MRTLILIFFVIFFQFNSYCQPSAATVQKDIKNDFGPNCISVAVLGSGSTSTEYINGGYSSFYRVSLNVKMKTDLPGVTKLLKGAAKYNYAGGNKYFYSQYAPGTSEYLGLPAPDTAKIRALILSMPDYGLAGASGVIIDVVSFSFLPSPPPLWHTLESVSVTAEMIYTRKDNNTTIETVKQPYWLRLYRKSATAAWDNVAWTTPDYRSDPRRKESLGKETIGEYKMSKLTNLLQKAQIKTAEKQTAARPKIDIPEMNSIVEIMKWYHGLLMEGDYAKVEAATLQLLHPYNFDKNTNLLNGNGQGLLNNLKQVLTNDYSTYNKQNCPSPEIVSKTDSNISWWNKDKSRATTLKIKTENGRWYIYEIGIYVWDFHWESRANATMNAVCK